MVTQSQHFLQSQFSLFYVKQNLILCLSVCLLHTIYSETAEAIVTKLGENMCSVKSMWHTSRKFLTLDEHKMLLAGASSFRYSDFLVSLIKFALKGRCFIDNASIAVMSVLRALNMAWEKLLKKIHKFIRQL